MSNPTISAELEEVLAIRAEYVARKYGDQPRPAVEIRYFEATDGNYEEAEGEEMRRQRFITDQALIKRVATGNILQRAAAQAELMAVGAMKVQTGARVEGWYQRVADTPIWLFLGTTVNDVRDFFDKLD
jgi:hypothetical protein